MIRNVLKPDGTVHIEQQVANMRYDRQHVELTTGNIRRNLGRPGFDTLL